MVTRLEDSRGGGEGGSCMERRKKNWRQFLEQRTQGRKRARRYQERDSREHMGPVSTGGGGGGELTILTDAYF